MKPQNTCIVGMMLLHYPGQRQRKLYPYCTNSAIGHFHDAYETGSVFLLMQCSTVWGQVGWGEEGIST